MSKIAYLDETGTASLNIEHPAVSKYFIVTAVVIDQVDAQDFTEKVNEIRKMHFKDSEIKSSSINSKYKHKRRKKILKDVRELDFKFYTLVVNKHEITQDSNLKHKTTFIKFINGKIYSALFQHFDEISLIADEHGDQDFIASLEKYVRNNHIPDLFKKSEFSTTKSSDCLGVQLADFVAGTIGQIYEGKADRELETDYVELLKEKCIGIDEWPKKYSRAIKPVSNISSSDSKVKYFASDQAYLYLEANSNKNDHETKLKICCLQHLLFTQEWMDADKYISTGELTEHLLSCGYGTVSTQTIRTNIIAKLRDDKVLIASSNSGYKIPSKVADMYDFAIRVDSVVVPLLRRLKLAKDSIYLASSGEVDILSDETFKILEKLIQHSE
tara:strand:+ start:1049 stop:2203 length:1155 start_codon:yes stop_codon:yes gene_type:complete